MVLIIRFSRLISDFEISPRCIAVNFDEVFTFSILNNLFRKYTQMNEIVTLNSFLTFNFKNLCVHVSTYNVIFSPCYYRVQSYIEYLKAEPEKNDFIFLAVDLRKLSEKKLLKFF